MARQCYYCSNEFGSDPCEAATAVPPRTFTDEQISSSMDGGAPRCPAKTASGTVCGKPLVAIPCPADPAWKRLGLIGGGAIAALALVVFGVASFITPSGESHLTVLDDPVVLAPTAAGGVSGSLRIRNDGKGALVIEGLDFDPPDFSAARHQSPIPPGGEVTLALTYDSLGSPPAEGTLSLLSNDPESPRHVRLMSVADPWWVYNRLESTSNILSNQP